MARRWRLSDVWGERVRGSDSFDRPGGALLDALRMVGELGVEELDQAVAFFGRGKDGDLVAQNLHAVVPLLVDEAAFAWGGATRR